jgi:hypothetical protein
LSSRPRVAAAALPGLTLLAFGIAIGAAGTLWWPVTLLTGVALASAVIGWGIAEAAGRLLSVHDSEAAPAEA